MKYGSLFLSVSGTYALPPILSAWMANNSEPHYRRATSVALGFVATNAVSNLYLIRMSQANVLNIYVGWHFEHLAIPEERGT